MIWKTECPSRGDGRSGKEKGGNGGEALEVAGIDVGCMPPARWHFRMSMGSLEMHLSGVSGG